MTKNIINGQEHYFRPYRWVMLILIAAIQISTNFCNIQISALAGTVMEALNLTTAQFGAVSSSIKPCIRSSTICSGPG